MIEIVDCEQGSPEWFAARAGICTASEFKTIIGVKKDAKEKVTRDLYMRKLAGEILTGEPMDTYSNGHMDRGKAQEDEARDLYAFATDVEPVRIGFVKNFGAGASPDSLIGDRGGLEIKTALAHIQIDRLLKGDFPPEYRAQVQGNIWITERDWWDFVSYSPHLPLLTVRVQRDDGYIATLAGAVKQFNEELAEMIEKIRRFGQPEQAAA